MYERLSSKERTNVINGTTRYDAVTTNAQREGYTGGTLLPESETSLLGETPTVELPDAAADHQAGLYAAALEEQAARTVSPMPSMIAMRGLARNTSEQQ
jgi:hypothetical protein